MTAKSKTAGKYRFAWHFRLPVFTILAFVFCDFSVGSEISDEIAASGKLRGKLHSFDIKVECKTRRLLDVAALRKRKKESLKIEDVILPWKDAAEVNMVYRQAWSSQGMFPLPKRRIETFGDDGELKSVLTYDGAITRSLYLQEQGAVGNIQGPPEKVELLEWRHDFLSLCGYANPARNESLARLNNAQSEVKRLSDTGEYLIDIAPENKSLASSFGYQVWLRPDSGWAISKVKKYSYLSPPSGTGDRIFRVSFEIVIDELHHVRNSLWVPKHAVIKEYLTRGASAGALVTHTDVSVDLSQSYWNSDFSSDVFTQDFPAGSRVHNSLIGVQFVVGKEDAGKNIDDLLANATNKIPLSREAFVDAEWSKELTTGNNMSPRWRYTLIGLNVIVIFGVLTLLWWRSILNKRVN